MLFFITVLGNYAYMAYYYSAFLSGPPVLAGTLRFITYGTYNNVTIPTNHWERLFCITAQTQEVSLEILGEGLFIKPITWAILKGIVSKDFWTPKDYERYNFKDFPYLNITYIRFKLVVFNGINYTTAVNYTAPIYKFNENNTEFPIYYSKKLGPYDYRVWYITAYLAFLDDTRENITINFGEPIEIVLLFGLYEKRTMSMAKWYFREYILNGYIAINLFVITVASLLIIKTHPKKEKNQKSINQTRRN